MLWAKDPKAPTLIVSMLKTFAIEPRLSVCTRMLPLGAAASIVQEPSAPTPRRDAVIVVLGARLNVSVPWPIGDVVLLLPDRSLTRIEPTVMLAADRPVMSTVAE